MIDKSRIVKVTQLHKDYKDISTHLIRQVVGRPEFAKFEVPGFPNPLRFYDTVEFRRLLVEGIKEHKTRKERRSKCIGYRHR